jgi:flagellin-like protein
MRVVHSLFRNKRGVSEIIASLILILIVSAAGVLAYSISLTTFSSSTSNYQLQMDQREAKVQERLEVLAVWWDRQNQFNLTLTVLNYGTIDLTIDKVYVNGTIVTTYISGTGAKIGPTIIIPVTFASPLPIATGQTYDIIVVSERGGKNEISWQA